MIDLSAEKSMVIKLIVKACEEYGFFNVINHGVPHDIISKMEEVGFDFFAKPMEQKKLVALGNPFGYGCKNIGFNGDMGEVEYLLLNANAPSIPNDSSNFRYVQVNYYFYFYFLFLEYIIGQIFCIYCMLGLVYTIMNNDGINCLVFF